MKNIALQGLVIVVLFFGSWFGLSLIHWVSVFKVEQLSDTTEKELGDLVWKLIEKTEDIITDKDVTAPLDSLITRICDKNNIDPKSVNVHVVKNSEVNAFALPNRHLVIYTGLISNSDKESELCGVMCHEIGHMEMSHVMKKMVKEMGLSVLISMTSGGKNGQVTKEVVKHLSSTAYDRSLEKEADIRAVDYCVAANINPEGLADFLYKLSSGEPEMLKQLNWLSTHPDSKERAEYIIEYSKGKSKKTEQILSQEAWDKLKKSVE